MHRSALRSLIVVPFLVTSVACGGSGGEGSSANADAPDGGAASNADGGASGVGSTSVDGGAGADGAASAPAKAQTVDVHGSVVSSYADVPIAGRTVRVLDATGKHVDVVTDASGHFAAPGTTTPYDVRISPEGLIDEATVYLGVSEPNPYLHGALASAPPAWVTQTFNIGVLLATACAGCEVSLVTKSAHGYGSAGATFSAGSSVASAALQHSFISDGSPSEAVTLHVLVYDAARTWFRYEEASLTAIAGRTSPGGVHTPPLVPVHPLSVTLQAAGVPANWEVDLLSALTFSDGSTTNILDVRGQSSLVTNVPAISGAVPAAYAWLTDPLYKTDRTIYSDVQTWSGTKAAATSSVVLAPTTPLHDVIPAPHSTVSLKGPGISWTALPSTVTQVYLIDVARSRSVAAVFTDGNNVTWDRLDALGVAVSMGEQLLEMKTSPHVELAAVVAGDATKRWTGDRSAAGSSSSQSWRFTLTP